MSIVFSIDFTKRNVYIVGGGAVAYRKAQRFLKEGAHVFVCAPKLDQRFFDMANIHLIPSYFSWDDVHDAFFIYAATDDKTVNAAVIKEAKRRNLLCGCAMQAVASDVRSMVDEEQEGIQFALSTKGNCPGADCTFLKQLQPYVQEINQKSLALKTLRAYILQLHKDAHSLTAVLQTIAGWDLPYIKKIANIVNGKQVILLAYHGIADVEKIQPILDEMEARVEAINPNICAITLFISEKITKKAQKKGYSILHCKTVSDCLDQLQISYVLQPMLLCKGMWFHQLQQWYPHIRIGEVYASNEEELSILYKQLKSMYPQGILCGLYHDNEAIGPSFAFQQGDYFYDYEQYAQVHIQNQMIHLFALTMFAGYHVKKDVHDKWLPYFETQGNHVTVHDEGCMHYAFIQIKLLEKIAKILD